ncbi:MAG: hypothetical protein AAFN93_25830 [Bacteroidota bacterium]
MDSRGFLWGAGMALRRSVFLEILNLGVKSILTDRSGKDLSSGGDTEICYWLRLAGYRLWYDEHLVFGHLIRKERLTLTYLEKLKNGLKESSLTILAYRTVFILRFKMTLAEKALILFRLPYYILIARKSIFAQCYIQWFTFNIIGFYEVPKRIIRTMKMIPKLIEND